MTALGDELRRTLAENAARPCLVYEDADPPRVLTDAEVAALADTARARLAGAAGARGAGAGAGAIVAVGPERTPEALALALAALVEDVPFAWLPARRGAQLASINDALRAPADGAACVLFTSGSTGAPKGVRIAADDLLARARTEVDAFGVAGGDAQLALLPFGFDVGLNQLVGALLAGATLHLTDAWLRRDLARVVARAAIRGFSAVPSVWAAALDDPRDTGPLFDGAGAAALRYVTVSGGSLPPATFDALARRLPGVRIHKTYGQTETFRSTAQLDANARPDDGTVGTALPGVRVTIAAGDVVHAGLGTMLGYLGDDALTRATLRDGAVHTGDHGQLDAHGRLTLLGRDDDMIKTAGQRYYPREIEDVLARHDAVAEAVVFGVPDARLGERAVAVVVVRASATADPAALRRFVAAELPSHMVPSDVAVWPSLPRTPSAKPARRAIRDAWLASRRR
jgi:acyl-coenzyme A synthetase/AMP-(fatty) acid ligase